VEEEDLWFRESRYIDGEESESGVRSHLACCKGTSLIIGTFMEYLEGGSRVEVSEAATSFAAMKTVYKSCVLRFVPDTYHFPDGNPLDIGNSHRS
jgi:hypothetical protein